MKLLSYAKQMSRNMLALAMCGALMVSCHSIYDDEGDCSVTYRVTFRYDMNMKFANAFAHEVKSVSLYVIGEDGKVAWQCSEQGEQIAAEDYAVTLNVAPGKYGLLAWCGLKDGTSFTVPMAQTGITDKEELGCTLNRGRDEAGNAIVTDDLTPLFHGYTEYVFTDEPGIQTVNLPLMKNTNTVRVVLQHLSGEPVNKDKFTFTITDANGQMAWDNALQPDEQITYYAWHTESGTAAQDAADRTVTSVSAAIAELTVARLVKENNPRLTITNDAGETVLSIPLIDYALLVKGNYNREMDDQEYLDRQDEYNMIFFLDERDHWYNSFIYINSWKVVLQHTEI